MPVLRYAPASPFVRMVRMAIDEVGRTDAITLEFADTGDEADALRVQNPLGKIPTLMLDDGSAIYDSRVIVEYLDHMAGGNRLLPTDFHARIDVLRLQALALGIMDAAVGGIYETRFRPEEKWHQPWRDYLAEKVKRALAVVETSPPPQDRGINAGHLALASALGYLDFRFDGSWRNDHPNLVAWLEAFRSRVPSYDRTDPQG